MNIKAERIEQMIQIINRNLLLIFSGQQHGVVPMDIKQLQRVDTVIFGHDKFAFEMVHFVKSASQNVKNDGQIFSIWERNFVTSLETLLVECAVVNDDIERDCFVSRVYCWFTEKLSERRELPRTVVNGVGDIQSSLRKLNVNSEHTARGLASYNPANSPDASLRLRSHPASTAGFGPQQTLDNGNNANDRDFPTITVPEKSKFGARKVPVYVKQGFPTVLQSNFEGQQSSFLPKIPGAEENYGMVYNVPETEAERTMHELWMARRRQEAFEWKTQQHLSLVMDRISLHKSRLESESLRRQESGTLLKLNRNRPASASDVTFGRAGSPDRSPTRPSTERARHRDAGRSSPRRTPQHTLNGRFSHLHPHVVSHNVSDTDDNLSSHPRDPHRFGEGTTAAEQNTTTTNVVLSQNGWESEAHIAKPSRISVARQKKEHLPMKFKMDLPDAFNVETTQQFYMQLSDSDDDDKPDRPVKPAAKGTFLGASTSQKQGKKKPGAAAGKPVEAQFKHERPIVRERPVSARLFRTVATADPEFKVHYRHTNYRRMPLTEQQEQWLDEREAIRSKKSQDLAHKLVADVQAKADKKKDKGKKDGDAKKKKDAKDKKGAVVVEEKPKSKYSTASQFMSSNFPNFEGDDDPQSMGPMRAMQLVEVARVMGCFDEYGVDVKESALRKALIIPQDRSEAICLENMRETASEGLMLNPLPREYWRAFTMKKGGKKKKKSKK